MKELVTLEKLRNTQSISQAIEWAKEQYGEYPVRPKKPSLKSNLNSTEAKQYATNLEKYENEITDFNERLAVWKADQTEINNVIERFIKDEVGFNIVPVKYQDKVWSKAWEMGHSSGYYEVYLKLNSLIEIFE